MILISELSQAKRNIEFFQSELKKTAKLQGVLSNHRRWYVIQNQSEIYIAPSKFIGYKDITGELYSRNNGVFGDNDGRETENRLKQWFENVDNGSALHRTLHEHLSSLLATFGKIPNARAEFYVLKQEIDKSRSRKIAKETNNLTLSLSSLVVFDPDICFGKPTLLGTRIRVSDVIQLLAGGDTTADILTDFPSLREEHIAAALNYAALAIDHRVIKAA